MTPINDPRVDAYIDALPAWQQAICREVRELVHAADPDVTETIKRTNQPYFVLEGNICALLAAKDHVNIFLYDGAIVPDPDGIITSGHDNKIRCHLSTPLPYTAPSSSNQLEATLAAGQGNDVRRSPPQERVLPFGRRCQGPSVAARRLRRP
jgi:hypothetical protein